ncbi:MULTISPECIES: hypothetical protein [unclassified Klebsiella]|uniref:hypothetical protein n=1 Tax=unclassified Klebsiella TaxID=2608929 RepID=UPI0021AFC9B6|nr:MULTISPECIES: hypothetical protein [unclassified Klebsiella]
MTVSTEVDHNDYTGNGVTTSFPYTFRIFTKTDLMVQVVDLNENITVLTLDTDYSVTGAGAYSGGSVVLPSPLENGWQISISRELPATQETDLRNQGKFFAEVHEDAFDKLTMLIQQCFSFLRLALRKPSFISNYYDALNNRIRNLGDPSQDQDAVTKKYADDLYEGSYSYTDKIFRRTLRVPESDVGMVHPVNVRSNMLLGFNDLGNPVSIAGQTETADLAIKLASTAGASLVYTDNGLSVQEMLSLGRVVYPEMFGVGFSESTDDELWERMFAYLESLPDTSKSNDLPYLIDMRGKEYTILQTHQVDINLGVINGFVHFNGGRFIFGDYTTPADGGKTRRYLIDFRWDYIGDSYFPYALVEIVRAYNTHIKHPTCWAGDSKEIETTGDYIGKPKRARHALWLGSRRAWGCSITGGDIYGGDIPLRVGYTNDHTGVLIGIGLTIHHAWTGNILGCNFAGSTILGCNIEHSENGAWSIALTSGTNGISNALRSVLIAGVYLYNNGNGTPGTDYAPAAILIGYDVPGTLGFDVAGQLITSDGQARNVTVQNCDIVSPKQLRAVKMRGITGLKCLNNAYTVKTGELYGFTFEGAAARSDCKDNWNQTTGVNDECEYTSTNKPRLGDRSGTFLPQLVGATVAGSIVYSTRGGDYSVSNGTCELSMWLTVGSISTQPQGALTINLPVSISAGKRTGVGISVINLAGNTTRTVNATGAVDSNPAETVTVSGTATIPNTSITASANITNGAVLNLLLGGSTMQGSVIQAATDIRVVISYPVDGPTYTGA